MAKTRKGKKSARFPKVPKGSPQLGPTPTGAKSDRRGGGGNLAVVSGGRFYGKGN